MSSSELKNKIFNKLQNVDDNVLLDVLELLEFETSTGKYQLTEAEIASIEIGLQQIENGDTISHENMVKEVSKWLSK